MSVNTKVNGQLVKSAGLYKASVPIQSGDIYSLEERQVGVWTDGKPLYQKTIDFGALPNATLKSVAHGIANIGICNIVGAFSKNSNNTIVPLPYATSTAQDQMQIYIDATNLNIRTSSNASTFSETYVTLQYTKTTDVAGSGEYVPSGDKAEHYDDTEQVIGTFLGETLYRKTINFGALPNNATKTVAHGISNLKYIKSYEGTAKSTSNGYFLTLPYIHSTSASKYVEMYFDATNISVATKEDRSVYDVCYITLEYTKTS